MLTQLFLRDSRLKNVVHVEKKETEKERKLKVCLGLFSKGQYCNQIPYWTCLISFMTEEKRETWILLRWVTFHTALFSLALAVLQMLSSQLLTVLTSHQFLLYVSWSEQVVQDFILSHPEKSPRMDTNLCGQSALLLTLALHFPSQYQSRSVLYFPFVWGWYRTLREQKHLTEALMRVYSKRALNLHYVFRLGSDLTGV